MTLDTLHELSYINGSPPYAAALPQGDRIEGLQDSHQLLDQFFESRELAQRYPGVRDERLDIIRNDVREWFASTFPDINTGKPVSPDDYATATQPSESMMGKLVGYLQTQHSHENGVSASEILASHDFLDATFSLNSDLRNNVDLKREEASHAFVVPVRLSTKHPEYSTEIRPLVPAFHYVPDELVPYFMRDFPTFVADRYVGGGYVLVAPVTDDMRRDLGSISQSTFINLARQRVNAAVDLGRALGVEEFGYGATFPGLMKLGEATGDKEAVTTTGHGGTTALMMMLIKKVAQEVMVDKKEVRIGVLGLGQIGLPAAQVVADFFPESRINVFDTRQEIITRLAAETAGRFVVSTGAKELIENSDIILSSATSTFNFVDPNDPNFVDLKSLEGKVIIDDSEPHSFLPEQVLALKGIVLDVVGRDYSGRVRRASDFGYGGTLANRELDAFGCELEVVTLSRYIKDLQSEGKTQDEIDAAVNKYALRRKVTAQDTRNWIALFERYGIGPAPLQVFGKAYEQARPKKIERVANAVGSLLSLLSDKLKIKQRLILAS